MKNLKNVVAILAMAFGLMITQSACTDPCKNVECNFGTCEEGTCKCDVGYEGTNCDAAVRTKFLGTYAFSENCNTGQDSYTVTITTVDADIQKIRISNIYNAGLATEATVSGTSLTIASQSFGTATISGSGSISGSNLTLSYSIAAGGATDACTGTGSK
jgi:hypothetical protein